MDGVPADAAAVTGRGAKTVRSRRRGPSNWKRRLPIDIERPELILDKSGVGGEVGRRCEEEAEQGDIYTASAVEGRELNLEAKDGDGASQSERECREALICLAPVYDDVRTSQHSESKSSLPRHHSVLGSAKTQLAWQPTARFDLPNWTSTHRPVCTLSICLFLTCKQHPHTTHTHCSSQGLKFILPSKTDRHIQPTLISIRTTVCNASLSSNHQTIG
jgi:hypothetical protein